MYMEPIELFRRAATALAEGQHVALVTVTSVAGSTPGKVGYKMLVLDRDRDVIGTVGGGRVEARMIDQARAMLAAPACRLVRFDLNDVVDRANGICGGSIELLVESFDPGTLPLFQTISTATDGDNHDWLVSVVAPDARPRKFCVAGDGLAAVLGQAGIDRAVVTAVAAVAKDVAGSGSAGAMLAVGDVRVFIELLAPRPSVVICGAGHLARHIARFARAVHFRVVVCDDRPEYARREQFPDADDVIVADFARIFETIPVRRDFYIVIVTRGHASDETVLERVVRTDARYIGMIGSRNKVTTVLQHLHDKGVPSRLLDRVYSPMGLAIGAITAEEIALSVVSELVKVRRLGDAAEVDHLTLSRRAPAS
ncbi:MAG: XdhC family protein [Pirellulaceae bacterium]|jgi:xanthine dehydrogenase accessory factor|nr:XdhC family protein [Pirellulaceae bacterium]